LAISSSRFTDSQAKLEAELAELPPEERGDFFESQGLTSGGLDRLIRAGEVMLFRFNV
jgi:ribosome-binding ATPase YchF (GTP1/OBG family)